MKKLHILYLIIFSASLIPVTAYADKDSQKFKAKRLEIRSYEGAPPLIPHGDEKLGRKNCLSCHKKGEAVKNGRTSPVTPHPNWINCRQCHVDIKSNALFVPSTYVKYEKDSISEPVNPLGAPYISHNIQNRENCRICHLSVTAKKAITPSHGERLNCTQCHVQLQEKTSVFP